MTKQASATAKSETELKYREYLKYLPMPTATEEK